MFNVNATNLVVFNVDTATSGTVGMFNVNATNRGWNSGKFNVDAATGVTVVEQWWNSGNV